MVSTRAPRSGPADTGIVQIRIEGTDLPGNSCGPSPERPAGDVGIHVGVQRRAKPAELLGVTPGVASAATWTLDAVVTPKPDGPADVRGPYIQGPPDGRFIYLNWGTVDDSGTFTMFRRAKLWLGRSGRRCWPTRPGAASSSASSA